MYQAQESFHAVLDDGTERFVVKGEILPDKHELVRRDIKGTGMLFRPLDLDEEPPPPVPPKARAQAAQGKTARGED